MRRPSPPPASEAEEREPERPVASALRLPSGADADPPPVDDGGASEPGGTQPVTGADVWRAARARRKALRAEIRRFTQRSRRRRIVWLSAAGAVVALVLGTVVAAYSPLFAVERITVVGAKTLDAAEIERALAGQVGTPIALVDPGEVKAALVAFPLIETYALEARPPRDLTVRIVERTPIGVVQSDAGYTLVDAAGVALSTTTSQPEGQPLLEIAGSTGGPAFESAGLVVRSLPAQLRGELTGVRASTADDVTLVLGGSTTVVWGNAEDAGAKSAALAGLRQAQPDAGSYDVSSPGVGLTG